jgi:cytochrome bd ubiquinol oxidase subunit II
MIVLWLLILRGIGVELRMHLDSPVWRGFFDGCFAISSLLLTIFYGAALGNVIRGVPLQEDGYFFLPLWTNWRVGPQPGVLDWYTVIAGLVAAIALTIHGAHYVALKTEGDLSSRARRTAATLWPALLVLTLVSLSATLSIRPDLLTNFERFPVLFLVPLAVAASLIGMFVYERKSADTAAFLCSSAYLIFMLVGAAAAVYPNLLMSTSNPAMNITVYNAATGRHSLSIGLIWWGFGMAVAVGYFVFVYRMFKGKVAAESQGAGYMR